MGPVESTARFDVEAAAFAVRSAPSRFTRDQPSARPYVLRQMDTDGGPPIARRSAIDLLPISSELASLPKPAGTPANAPAIEDQTMVKSERLGVLSSTKESCCPRNGVKTCAKKSFQITGTTMRSLARKRARAPLNARHLGEAFAALDCRFRRPVA